MNGDSEKMEDSMKMTYPKKAGSKKMPMGKTSKKATAEDQLEALKGIHKSTAAFHK